MSPNANELYLEKNVVNYYSTARTEIERIFPSGVGKVLEVGCGAGATLIWLKQSGLARWVGGVDINQNELDTAISHGVDFARKGNIETSDDLLDSDEQHSFDVVLFLDVLEHLYNPWKVVGDIKKYISRDGCVIASIPNVQNVRVIVPLIFGRFEYKQCGLLDKTHIRFFTKETAQRMFLESDYTVLEVKPIYDRKNVIRFVNFMTFGLFRRFFVMQYLILAKPRS